MTDRPCALCGKERPKKREHYCSKACANRAMIKDESRDGNFWRECEEDSLKRIRQEFWLDERRPAKYVAKTLAECEALNKAMGRPTVPSVDGPGVGD